MAGGGAAASSRLSSAQPMTGRQAPRHLSFAMIAILVAACGGTSGPTAAAGSAVTPSTSPSALPSTSIPAAQPTETALPSPKMPPTEPPTPALSLTSTAFAPNGAIPVEYSCRGADRSPDLAWSGVPSGTKALVLFVDDPDGRDWVHWSVLDIDPSTSGLPAGVEPGADAPQQGTNDFGRVGYGGPCPPSGTHHYQFTLYALPAPLGLPGHPNGGAVRASIAKATPLASVTLVGTFAR